MTAATVADWTEQFRGLAAGEPAGTYPGSRHPLTVPQRSANNRGWDERPKVKVVNGESMEFFTTGQLAQALGREAVTIRKWERDGIIPKPMYHKSGSGGDPRGRRRYYTRDQVEGIQKIAFEEGLLKGDQRSIKATRFTERVIDLFRMLRTK